MVSRRAVAALFLSQLLAAVAFAQSVVPATASDASVAAPSEFGRVYGGDLEVITKHPRQFSGTLGMTLSRSPFGSFGSGSTKGYDATFGGTAVEDRVWFFAAAHQNDALLTSRFATTPAVAAMSDGAVSRGIDTKLNALIGSRQSLAATFAAGREPIVTNGIAVGAPAPSSFLSLHYTGVVSDNMFFTANVSRSRAVQPELLPIIR